MKNFLVFLLILSLVSVRTSCSNQLITQKQEQRTENPDPPPSQEEKEEVDP